MNAQEINQILDLITDKMKDRDPSVWDSLKLHANSSVEDIHPNPTHTPEVLALARLEYSIKIMKSYASSFAIVKAIENSMGVSFKLVDESGQDTFDSSSYDKETAQKNKASIDGVVKMLETILEESSSEICPDYISVFS